MPAVPQRTSRVKKEIRLLLDSNEGFVLKNADQVETNTEEGLVVVFNGPQNSPFSDHTLRVSVCFTPRYPFEPPIVEFIDPVYHPNIDGNGRICLDLLTLPPKGAWKPTVSLIALLNALRILLMEPNPDDPLVPEIAREYLSNRELYTTNARAYSNNDGAGTMPSPSPFLPNDPAEGSDKPRSLLSMKRTKLK